MVTLRADLGHPSIRVPIVPMSMLMIAGAVAFLAVVAAGTAQTQADLSVAQWVQAIDVPGLGGLATVANFLTSAPIAIGLWLVTTAFFVLRGRPLEAIAVFSIFGIWIVNQFVGMVVDRPSPSLAISEMSRADSGSFPSGHTTGAVVFYGTLTFLAFSNIGRTSVKIWVIVGAVAIVGLTALSRVYVGAHWPSDVLASLLIGALGVVAIGHVYTLIKEDRLSLPRFHKKQAPPTIDGVTVTGSVASRVLLDWKAGTATKEYRPPWLVRALYWVAFQAPFPYQANGHALLAAAANRKIVGLLTRHRFGQDMIAPVLSIDEADGRYRLVTELVEGIEPESNSAVAETLSEFYHYFQETGLPTWQISPANPHAHTNFIRNRQGELKLIDIESSIVSFSPPFGQLRAALRDGLYPVFDDVDFIRLRAYLQSQREQLVASLTMGGLEELKRAIDEAEAYSISWKQSEPRIWGRIARTVYAFFNWSPLLRRAGRMVDGAEAMATSFLNAALDRWEVEKRIDAARAADLRDQIQTSEVASLLKHLGAHIALSVALRFPFGSIARFAWVAYFRLKARYDRARARITREEYAEARSIHSIPVMLISLIPGFGTIAYMASGTVRSTGLTRLLIDQIASKLPFRLYGRLGLSNLTAPRQEAARPRGIPLRKRVLTGCEDAYQHLVSSVTPPQHAHATPRAKKETRI